MKHLFRSLLVASVLAFTFVVPPLARASDLSITAANFLPGSTAKYHSGISGASVTAGQLIAIAPASGKYVLADANDADLCKVAGIAAHASAPNQPLAIVWYSDDMTLGATLNTSYPVYILSATPGGIAVPNDLGAGGMYPVVCIIGISSTKCVFRAGAIAGTTLSVAD